MARQSATRGPMRVTTSAFTAGLMDLPVSGVRDVTDTTVTAAVTVNTHDLRFSAEYWSGQDRHSMKKTRRLVGESEGLQACPARRHYVLTRRISEYAHPDPLRLRSKGNSIALKFISRSTPPGAFSLFGLRSLVPNWLWDPCVQSI